MTVRPIDANAMLIDENEAYINVQAKLDPDSINYKVNWAVHRKVQMLLADTPTLDDYEPVRRSRWATVCMGTRVCKYCNGLPPYDQYGYQALSKYCPNCGAKMDGGQHDH